MKRFSAMLLAAGLAVAPTFAHAGSIHTNWEKYKAGRALKHLSNDGQRALVDILQARDLLSAGKTDQAIPALYDATKRLEAAKKADTKLTAAENALTPAPQHPAAPSHVPSTTPTEWVPVGGEWIASETLAPEKKAAVGTANGQLKTGTTQQAAETMQVVGEDVDFIVALAPIAQTEGAVNRATVFTEGRDAKSAVDALNSALGGIVFVSDDFVDSMSNNAPAKGATAKKS
ncbi:YfdX family protein [Acetobacter musti]|uniref:YfdX family protein n=1 Tax=Acetobacter musti TaxID=864732 RepID=A0ABX0JLH5_9PROT|nr:YfdX family protein [Acetobacter musti]NHN83608.1 YfdX family protein [Acetobacter musti]